MLACIAAFLFLGVGRQGNLLENPTFSHGLDGWGPLYTRAAVAGTVALDDGRAGQNAIKVVHTGSQDWAFFQSGSVPTSADDVFELSAWLKVEMATDVSISVVTIDANGKTIDWLYGSNGTSGTHDWRQLKRRIVIPTGCASIRFRLVGNGPGTVWMEQPSLTRLGKVEDFVNVGVKAVTLTNARLKLTVAASGALAAEDTRNGRTWCFGPPDAALRVKDLRKISPDAAELTLLDLDGDMTYTAKFKLASRVPEADLVLEGEGPMPSDLAYPGALVTSTADALIVPMNEGILFPAADPNAPAFDLVTYGGHGISMPWYGVVDSKTGAGAMGIYLTPDDALLRTERPTHGLLEPRPVWQASRHEFRYPRRLRLAFFDKGGYVALAKRYREHAAQQGLLVTLKQKTASCPYVDRLIGAVNVWNWDMDAVSLCKEMKGLGMDHVLWSRGGKPEELTALNAMGYLTSRYDIYQDVYDPKIALSWMNTAGWPEDLVQLDDGDWMKGWAHPDKQADGSVRWIQGGVISSGAGLSRAEKLIPAELKEYPYHCRFLDTTTASPFREDYNPAHPLSRSDDRKNKMALLEFCSKAMGLVVGSETGLDASVPYLEYFEGMMSLGPYRLPDAGTDMMAYRKPTPDFLKYQVGSYYRLPLWELVYHDCTVAQWYWGDASNKEPEVWDRRDLLNILYGTAPLLLFDKEHWQRDKARMVKTYKDVCNWTRLIGYDEMLSHEFLTADHLVQRTRFASGRSVIVNFGTSSWMSGDIVVRPLGFKITP